MWGRRKRGGRLNKQLALGLLEDAMSRAEQQDPDDPDANPDANPDAGRAEPYPSSIPVQAEAFPQPRAAEQTDLEPADVPVDNSAAPPAGDVTPPPQRQRSGEHSAESTRHGSLG